MSEVHSPNFFLRPMRVEDIAGVHALEERIFPIPWSLESYHFEVERNPASKPWVVEAEDRQGRSCIAAYIVPWLLVDELHIANIAVAPQYRRLGLGRRMLSHVLMRAAVDGAIRATLELRASNDAAKALYEEMGFRQVGRRKHYYGDNGEDALLMQLAVLDSEIAENQLEAL